MPTSPYSAPTTPIASAKRPRINDRDKEIKSPIRRTSQAATGQNNSKGNNNTSNTSSKTVNVPIRMTATSKALFSPVGQASQDEKDEEDGEEAEQQSKSRIKSGSSEEGNLESKGYRGAQYDEYSDMGNGEEQGQNDDQDDDSEEDVFNPYQFISGLPKVTSIVRNKVMIPPATDNRPTLALDLDETLVHCTVEPIDNPDLIFPVTFNGTLYDVYVRKRPYLDYFLETVSIAYEVVVFTASQRVYADVLLDLLDPKKKYIKHRLFRESCVMVQGNFLKDLHVLGRDYSRTALVDNSPHAYGFQVENGIPIESWFDDDTDTELLKLVGFLRKAFAASDVRSVIRDHFKTHILIERASAGEEIDLAHAPPY